MQEIELIHKVSKIVKGHRLEQLILEENLLTSLVRKVDVGMKVKKKALERINEINKIQLKMLGETM